MPVNAWEIDPAGYSSASARSYDSIKLQVRKVVIRSSWTQVGMTNANCLFNSFQSMTEVSGFENMSGITNASQMLSSCPALETIYATSFSNSRMSGSLMFNGCNRLVGGTDSFVPSSTSGASVSKLGAGGVFTDPNNDGRLVLRLLLRGWRGRSHGFGDTGGGRTLVASGRVCAEAKYVGLGFTPLDGVTGPTHRQHLTSATFTADMAGFSCLNLNYLFYSCTNLASLSGLGNLSGVRSMRFMFASCAVMTLDFQGFDPSTPTDLYYAFSGCSSLTTIYADSAWTLPSSGISGSQCFYSCSTLLVSGSGTVWASNKTAHLLPHRHGGHSGIHHSGLSYLTSCFAETCCAVLCERQLVSNGREIMCSSSKTEVSAHTKAVYLRIYSGQHR